MLASLEIRAPFLDPAVIAFAFQRVPDRLKMRGAHRKILLRKLAARMLPRRVVERGKQGFVVPLQRWFAGEFGRLISTVLLESTDSIFDRKMVDRLLDGQRKGYRNESRLFSLALFELWRSKYRVTA